MATDYDDCTGDGLDNDEQRETTEFGCCLPPGECCMPGLHFPSECHTSDDYDSPFCECGDVHGIEEIDSNCCDSCGKEIEP